MPFSTSVGYLLSPVKRNIFSLTNNQLNVGVNSCAYSLDYVFVKYKNEFFLYCLASVSLLFLFSLMPLLLNAENDTFCLIRMRLPWKWSSFWKRITWEICIWWSVKATFRQSSWSWNFPVSSAETAPQSSNFGGSWHRGEF